MRDAAYWRQRSALLEASAHKNADESVRALEELYQETQREVRQEIESWYARFARDNQLTLAEAKKRLTAGEMEEFRWSVEQYVKVGKQAGLDPAWQKKLANASARFHISRLEAIELQIQQQIELLYGNQVDEVDELLRKVVGEGYTHTAFEVQKGLGAGWDIAALDPRKLDALLTKPWSTDHKTFRDRCWTNKEALVGEVSKRLTQGLLRGDAPAKTIAAIQKTFGVHRYKAARLVHTETTYFNSVASRQAYQDLDVEQVEIIETLDGRTCEICGDMDGKIIPLSQYEPGVTVPPYHPNCRGTTAPAIDAKWAGKRLARDGEDELYEVPADMTYAQWKEAFVDGGKKSKLTRASDGAILKPNTPDDGGAAVQTVGYIDREKYSCITKDITTDEVVLTPERVQHIKDRHPGHFERIEPFLRMALEDPDYILADKSPNTGLILKMVEREGTRFQTVLRVHTSADNPAFKNSIISSWEISESRWENYIKNKTVLYKKE